MRLYYQFVELVRRSSNRETLELVKKKPREGCVQAVYW